MSKVITVEEPSIKVIPLLREKGYILSSTTGVRQRLQLDALGLMRTRPPKQEKFLFWNRMREGRALVIAMIWFENRARGAIKKKLWCIEVFGGMYLQEIQELAEELSDLAGVEVKVILTTEGVRVETLFSDYER